MPPVAVAVAVPFVPPVQLTLVLVAMADTSAVGSVTMMLVVAVQLLASVTV